MQLHNHQSVTQNFTNCSPPNIIIRALTPNLVGVLITQQAPATGHGMEILLTREGTWGRFKSKDWQKELFDLRELHWQAKMNQLNVLRQNLISQSRNTPHVKFNYSTESGADPQTQNSLGPFTHAHPRSKSPTQKPARASFDQPTPLTLLHQSFFEDECTNSKGTIFHRTRYLSSSQYEQTFSANPGSGGIRKLRG